MVSLDKIMFDIGFNGTCISDVESQDNMYK